MVHLGRPAQRSAFKNASPLIRRFEEFIDLSDAACVELAQLASLPRRQVPARNDLICQDDNPRHVYLIQKGWAYRYKVLPNGRRQIVDFLIPGDLCDLNMYILSKMDHSIGALTLIEVTQISRDEFEELTNNQPQIMRALWWQELVSKSCHREWIVNVAARTALERIAHLMCEMFLRLESVGETDGYSCHFPPTQQDLGDATGLTSVHVNRTLKQLREKGLIKLSNRILTIPNMDALKQVGQFNGDYLHLERLNRHPNEKGPFEI